MKTNNTKVEKKEEIVIQYQAIVTGRTQIGGQADRQLTESRQLVAQ